MYDCIVIGAGQAGLAAAYYLARAGRHYLLLEAHDRVGDSWRYRWDGLQLFTPNRYNRLPGSRFPGADYVLPDRLAVADYFETYVAEQGLRVRIGARVGSVTPTESSTFAIRLASGETLGTRTLVIAAGAYRTPRVPGFAERLPAGLPTVHTADLRSAEEWLPSPGQHVLVVGAGASGTQVARLLNKRHRVTLAGRDPGHLPRRVLGRDVYDYLYGAHVLQTRVDSLAGRALARQPVGGEVRVGESVNAIARREGIARVGRVEGYDGDFVLAGGGVLSDVDAVAWATGYRNRYPFLRELPGALDAEGRARHELGHSPVPGLWWMGLHLMRRVNSSLLGGVGRDAGEVVSEVGRYLRRSSGAVPGLAPSHSS